MNNNMDNSMNNNTDNTLKINSWCIVGQPKPNNEFWQKNEKLDCGINTKTTCMYNTADVNTTLYKCENKINNIEQK